MDKVPLRVRSQVIAMNQARWMDGYLTEKGRAAVFARLDKRASFETHFDKAMQVLLEKEQALTSLHKVFFLELRKQNFNAQP